MIHMHYRTLKMLTARQSNDHWNLALHFKTLEETYHMTRLQKVAYIVTYIVAQTIRQLIHILVN